MNTLFHAADARGHARHGWLNARHSFSFAGYQDPTRMHFGVLRVLNDDVIAPAMGFGRHPHDNMEIITIPLRGAIEHKDSTGGHGIIHAGDVQVMSAGTGVQHSEANASRSEDLNLLQLWIFPARQGLEPRYDQMHFSRDERRGSIRTIISPDKLSTDTLWINQNAWLSLAHIEPDMTLDYTLHDPQNGLYCFVISGPVNISGTELSTRDALGLSEISTNDPIWLRLPEDADHTESEVLLIEVPMG